MKYFAFYRNEDGFSLDEFQNMEQLSDFLSNIMKNDFFKYTLDENEDVERGRVICLKGELINPKPIEKVTAWSE